MRVSDQSAGISMNDLALHEAGHAVAFLVSGIRVTALTALDSGGACYPDDPPMPSWETAVAILAGSTAVHLFGADPCYGYDDASPQDMDMARQALSGGSPALFRSCWKAAEWTMLKHEVQVRVLAAELLGRWRGQMNLTELARSVWDRPALAVFRDLYRRPAERPAGASNNGFKMRTSKPSLPGKVWSERYQCWLATVPPVAGQRLVATTGSIY